MPLPHSRLTDPLPTTTDSVGGEQLSSASEENREYPRLPFRGRAKAIVFPAPTSMPGTDSDHSEVMTCDISRGGISILYRAKLCPGQRILLMLQDTSQLVEVCWCCPVWDGLYAAGCRFLSEAKSTDTEQWLLAVDVVINEYHAWDAGVSD
jgi:hypothetical protein